MTTVAFLGLGRMGSGMARRLLAQGASLHVYNRTGGPAEALARDGAQRFESARAACEGADVIFSMVSDDAASRAIWMGPHGALAAMPATGSLLIECSTLSHGWVLELAGTAHALGLRYIDAPVTGLPADAASGRLALLVGAGASDLSAARPFLDRIASKLLHFGPVGMGTAYKLLVNLLGAVQIASAAETMAIAERIGLDPTLVADALATGQAASPQVVRNTRRMVSSRKDEPILFTPQLRLKDVEYALALVRSAGMDSPFGQAAAQAYRQLCALGFAQASESEILEWARTSLPRGSPAGN